jgi:hypothetical protein
MSTLAVDKQINVRTSGASNDTILRRALLAIAVIYIILSLYLIFETRSRLTSAVMAQDAAIERLRERQAASEENLKASNNALAQQLGITERGLQAAYAGTTAEIRQNQRAFERRLQDQQNAAADQVTFEVANVRTELNGAKEEIAATRTDLESTKVKLDRAVGDLTGQSSLIARTRADLEELRHRGDRNYYEFTLNKGERPTRLSSVSLQLKKADAKKNKFTINVIADDRTIEKKDRGAAEPLQFYTGRDRQLYEVVIFTVEKNRVSGYLSTPKSVGTPVSQ